MVMRKQLDKRILITALIITTMIFVSGVIVGINLNQQKVDIIYSSLIDVNRELENFQIETLFFKTFGENATCPLLNSRLSYINKQTNDLGNKLELYRGNTKEKDDTYIKLRSEYTRITITYWLLAKEMRESCHNTDYITTVYFFSENCADCDSQSFILTYYKEILGDKLLNFAIDTTYPEPSLEVLKNYYNINEYPTLVIEDNKYVGLVDKEKMRLIFCSHFGNLSIC
jgi:hypothetical protein